MNADQLDQLHFDNRLAEDLPTDVSPDVISRMTPGVLHSVVKPTAVASPRILAWSDEAGALLDLQRPSDLAGREAQVFSGNQILPGSKPYATRYGGHQFGHWANQLGDGRAISLGEILNKKHQRWEIQLKGAGPTPYSRRADGRAVLRSSLREFLCSEAMFHLGVPTTRALCCILTGDQVVRDMFYDGHPEAEPGAIVPRLAPSFLRFGHYEILAAHQEKDLLKKLVEHTWQFYFPEIQGNFEEKLVLWFDEICRRTATLMADWLRVGFVHGVMNTDNMSILGLTIDYGPYGWLDIYDPQWTPNTTDREGRYSYGQQPSIGLWNLNRLAGALSVLLEDPKKLEPSLQKYREVFEEAYAKIYANKLGFQELKDEADYNLVQELEELLVSTEVDFTLFFRRLAHLHTLTPEQKTHEGIFLATMQDAFYDEKSPLLQKFSLWFERYLQRAEQESPTEMQKLMNATNPAFLVRNYLAQTAIDELAAGKTETLEALMKAMKTPYEENEATKKFMSRRPEWARNKAGCSALSCSS